jgi:small-conductance mechanosensitive channel
MRIPHVALLVLAGGLWSAPLVAQDSVAPAVRPSPAGYPIVLGHDTVLRLHADLPPYTLEQRGLAVTGLLAQAAGRADLDLAHLRVATHDGRPVILADSVALLAVQEGDALAEGVPADTLAARWARTLELAFTRHGERTWSRELLTGALVALLATLLFAFTLWFVLKIEDRMRRRVHAWTSAQVERLDGAKVRLVTPAAVATTAMGVTRLLRLALLLTAGYLWLVTVFESFAYTRPLAGRIVRFVTEPITRLARDVVGYLPSLFFIAVMIVALRLVLSVVRTVFRGIEQGTLALENFPAEWADPTYKIIRALVIAFGFILVFPYLPGAGSDAFNAISLFAGALFSLGSTGAVSNLVAGAVIVYTGAFRVGDFVRIGDSEGMVVERSLLVTRVRTVTNVQVSIPNGMVLGSHVQNFTTMAAQGGLVVQSRVTIGYDAPWRKVHELLIDGARRTEGVLPSPAPYVVQEQLSDYYPCYVLNAYTDRATGLDILLLRSRLNESIQDAFFEGGVEILSPAFTAVRDGNRTAMPPSYLPPDYRAPGFKVERDGGAA